MKESWIFLGNPGVGKSTLLNCLAHRAVFPAGVSYGGGLTMDVMTYADPIRRIVYTDTPGLADRTAQRTAAAAITRALRASGPHGAKLCFVVRLQYGRIVTQDLATMELVLDSIRGFSNVPFAILINCVDAASCRKLVRDRQEFKRVITLLNSGKYTTPHVLVIPEIPELVDADNCVVAPPRGMRQAIEQFPTAVFPRHCVADIAVDGFSQSDERLARRTSMLKRDDYALQAKQHELEHRKPDYWRIAAGALGLIMQLAVFV